jgi:hypothetical protein
MTQLLDIFLTGADSLSLNTDFVSPWTDWDQFHAIEPLVQDCIDLTGRVRTLMPTPSSERPAADTAALVDETIRIIAQLGHTACLTVQCPPYVAHPGYFNGLLRADDVTSVAVAKSLYLTLRLHATDILLSLVGQFEAPLDHVLKTVVVDELCKHIRQVVNGNLKRSQGEPGMAARLFLMSWPMLAVLQSPISSIETKSWIQNMFGSGR